MLGSESTQVSPPPSVVSKPQRQGRMSPSGPAVAVVVAWCGLRDVGTGRGAARRVAVETSRSSVAPLAPGQVSSVLLSTSEPAWLLSCLGWCHPGAQPLGVDVSGGGVSAVALGAGSRCWGSARLCSDARSDAACEPPGAVSERQASWSWGRERWSLGLDRRTRCW